MSWDEKKPSNLARTKKEKPEDCVEIADKKIDEKAFNPMENEEENQS